MAMEVEAVASVAPSFKSFQWKLEAPVEVVWEVTSNFVGLRKWAPSIVKSCRMVEGEDPLKAGCVRRVDNFHQAFAQQARAEAQIHQEKRAAAAAACACRQQEKAASLLSQASSSSSKDESSSTNKEVAVGTQQEEDEDEEEEEELPPLYAIERLLELDQAKHQFKYKMEESNLPMISHIDGYTATFKLSDVGHGCTLLTWSFESRPCIANPLPLAHRPAHEKAVLSLYESAIADLRKYLSSYSSSDTTTTTNSN